MKSGYQIYKRRIGEQVFEKTGLANWFASMEEAIQRCEELNRTWDNFEYIVVSNY